MRQKESNFSSWIGRYLTGKAELRDRRTVLEIVRLLKDTLFEISILNWFAKHIVDCKNPSRRKIGRTAKYVIFQTALMSGSFLNPDISGTPNATEMTENSQSSLSEDVMVGLCLRNVFSWVVSWILTMHYRSSCYLKQKGGDKRILRRRGRHASEERLKWGAVQGSPWSTTWPNGDDFERYSIWGLFCSCPISEWFVLKTLVPYRQQNMTW